MFQGLSILMYHSIANNPNDPHSIPPDVFAQQMAALATIQRRVVDLSEAIAQLRRRQIPKQKTVALTFDDGYEDFLTNAVPILCRYQFPATVFVPVGLIGQTSVWDTYDKTKMVMDWDEIGEASRMGFSIASHAMSHVKLTECTAQALEFEVRGSLEVLQTRLPGVSPMLSYPGGYFGRRERQAARDAGYIGAVGVSSHWRNYPWTDRYHLRRRRWPV